jgi:hypothetical protein
MKRVKVSALRERGLRPAGRDAEPQVVGLALQTTNERKANTMTTYILRYPEPVESQNLNPNPPPPGLWRGKPPSELPTEIKSKTRF